MNERVNKMNELQEQDKKRMVEWLASVPHVDELLALQLQGTIPKQMPGDVQTNGYLREIAQKSRRELGKARYILERQGKPASRPFRIMPMNIHAISAVWEMMHLLSSMCWEIGNC